MAAVLLILGALAAIAGAALMTPPAGLLVAGLLAMATGADLVRR